MDYSQAFFLYVAGIKLCDALVVAVVWNACWLLRFDSHLFPILKGTPDFVSYQAMTLPLTLVYCCLFHIVGAYRSDRVQLGFKALKKVVEGSVLSLLVFIAVLYFTNEVGFSRLYLLLFLSLLTPAVLLERSALHLAWQWIERHKVKKIRLLLIGYGDLLQIYVNRINIREPYPVEWVGRLGDPVTEGPLSKIAYLGTEDRVRRSILETKADGIVVSYPTDKITRYADILESASNELVTIKVLPDFGKYSTFTYSAEHECSIPLLLFNKAPVGMTDRVLKRFVDFSGAGILILLSLPIYALIAILIKLTSRGPILYSQERVGADGNAFTIYKFRTMRTDAEAETGAVWATAGDARTTRLGKWLRRTSLDETPQFFNVLKGDMSLVGPRPERPVFVDRFRNDVPKYMLRHKMKSGITGWAQINGWRGNTSIDERIKHDLYYIENWSHLFDIKILLMTLTRGFTDRHAY